jgi:hypothetical protein
MIGGMPEMSFADELLAMERLTGNARILAERRAELACEVQEAKAIRADSEGRRAIMATTQQARPPWRSPLPGATTPGDRRPGGDQGPSGEDWDQ